MEGMFGVDYKYKSFRFDVGGWILSGVLNLPAMPVRLRRAAGRLVSVSR